MEDDFKVAGNTSLVERADVEESLGVELEEYEIAVSGLEYGFSVSSGPLVETY